MKNANISKNNNRVHNVDEMRKGNEKNSRYSGRNIVQSSSSSVPLALQSASTVKPLSKKVTFIA